MKPAPYCKQMDCHLWSTDEDLLLQGMLLSALMLLWQGPYEQVNTQPSAHLQNLSFCPKIWFLGWIVLAYPTAALQVTHMIQHFTLYRHPKGSCMRLKSATVFQENLEDKGSGCKNKSTELVEISTLCEKKHTSTHECKPGFCVLRVSHSSDLLTKGAVLLAHRCIFY